MMATTEERLAAQGATPARMNGRTTTLPRLVGLSTGRHAVPVAAAVGIIVTCG